MNGLQQMKLNRARRSLHRRHFAGGGVVDGDPNEIAAARVRDSVRPIGGRHEGAITQALDAIGTDVYNSAARPSRIINAMVGAKPGDLTNGLLPQVDEAVPTVAFDLMAGGMGAAKSGTAGIFGGKLAKTADHAALARAEEMVAKGANRDQIWKETGWFKGADDKWRFEIPDEAAKLNPNTYKDGLPKFGQPGPVAGHLWHPELYDAYPEARQTIMRIERGDNVGRFFPGDKPVAQVEASTLGKARSIGLHEMQHDVQAREGFAMGTNPEEMRRFVGEKTDNSIIEQLRSAISRGDYGGPGDKTFTEAARNLLKLESDWRAERSLDAYTRVAGEVEARNVQARANMNPDTRRTTPPWATEDVPLERQIVPDKPQFADGGVVAETVPDWAKADSGGVPDWAHDPAPSATAQTPTWTSHIPAALRDIPHEAYEATADALRGTRDAFVGRDPEKEGTVESVLKTGKGLLSAASVPFAPVVGAARSLIGHPLADATRAIGENVANPVASYFTGEKGHIPDNPEEMYAHAKEGVDTAAMALAPGRGVRPAPVPAPPPKGPLGVTLSKGQATGELPLIQREQAALRGATGDRAQARAQEFADQQRAEVQAAHENVAKDLDPFGQRVAETPADAGALVSDAIQNTAASRKAGVKAAYDAANEMPGEIHAGAFEGIAQRIKGDLSLRDEPVIIDDKTTPHANNALSDIEKTIDRLRIPNKADPFGEPNPENIVGVNLKGVEQIRKRLSTFRRDAYGSGNAADGRATSAIIDSFDKRVDAAVDGGLFNGDPRAIQAWKDARAAHADYSGTFTAAKGDSVGRVVEKILGKGKNEAAIPNDVADFLYGSSGVKPNSLNVGVAKRVRGILGDRSPEWSAVKQGLFSRLTEPAPGMTEMGPGKVAQRLNRFLGGDGREMAEVLFSPAERQMLQSYADLQRQLQVPQAGANWSGTSTVLAPMLKKLQTGLASVVGAMVGHVLAPGLHGAGEGAAAALAAKVSGGVSQMREVRRVANQMPLVAEQLKKWQTAVNNANRANTPPSQTALGIATANLSRGLASMGISPANVGLVPVGATAGGG